MVGKEVMVIRSAALLVLALLALPTPSLAKTSSAETMPGTLFSSGYEYPIFVSIDHLLTPRGETDRSLIADYAADRIDEYSRRKADNGCIQLGGIIHDYVNQGGPNGSFSHAVRSADLVMLGTVDGLSPGFRGDEAGSLVRVKPASFLKGGVGEVEEAYYVFIPVASFSFRGRSICKSDPDYPALPSIGDSLLLLIRDRQQPTGPYLQLFDATDMVVIKADSTLDLPFRFRTDLKLRGLNKAALLQQARLQIQAEN